LALNKRPPNTGDTVSTCPLGRWTREGGIEDSKLSNEQWVNMLIEPVSQH